MTKLVSILTLVICFCLPNEAETITNPLMASDTVVWAGLDYSMVRMIGTDKLSLLYNFTVPDAIFPGMPERWNQLFLDERVERVAAIIGKKVRIDINGVTERNKTASKDQIRSE